MKKIFLFLTIFSQAIANHKKDHNHHNKRELNHHKKEEVTRGLAGVAASKLIKGVKTQVVSEIKQTAKDSAKDAAINKVSQVANNTTLTSSMEAKNPSSNNSFTKISTTIAKPVISTASKESITIKPEVKTELITDDVNQPSDESDSSEEEEEETRGFFSSKKPQESTTTTTSANTSASTSPKSSVFSMIKKTAISPDAKSLLTKAKSSAMKPENIAKIKSNGLASASKFKRTPAKAAVIQEDEDEDDEDEDDEDEEDDEEDEEDEDDE